MPGREDDQVTDTVKRGPFLFVLDVAGTEVVRVSTDRQVSVNPDASMEHLRWAVEHLAAKLASSSPPESETPTSAEIDRAIDVIQGGPWSKILDFRPGYLVDERAALRAVLRAFIEGRHTTTGSVEENSR
jgi:hypothetical protein